MAKKIRPTKLQYKWKENQDKTHKRGKNKVTLTRKYIRAQGLQLGRQKNLHKRVNYLESQIDSITQDYHIHEHTISEHGKEKLHRQASELFRDLELFMRGETIFQKGKKDTRVEELSSDRMHNISNKYMILSTKLLMLEKRGLVEEGFKNSCIREESKVDFNGF
jgi:hypothetical protein